MAEYDEARGIPRRSFLAYGSACLAASLWLKPTVWNPARTAAPDDQMSIGYSPHALSDAPSESRLVEARSLFGGDPAFTRTAARVNVLGMIPTEPAHALLGLKSVAVDVDYPVSDRTEPLQFHAWRFDNGPIPHFSHGNSFTVPIASETGLTLTLEIEEADGARRRTASRFTVGGESGLPKLRRGVYFLAPTAQPSWRDLRWRIIEGGQRRLVPHALCGDMLKSADFLYLVIAVDHARSAAQSVA